MNTSGISPGATKQTQKGFVLMLGLVLMVVITLVAVSVIRLGMANLRAVNNMHARAESLSAVERTLDRILSSPFSDRPEDFDGAFTVIVDDRDVVATTASRSYTVNADRACITGFTQMTSEEMNEPGVFAGATAAEAEDYKSNCVGSGSVNPGDNAIFDLQQLSRSVRGCQWVNWKISASVSDGWFGSTTTITQGVRLPMWFSKMQNTWADPLNRCPGA